MRLVGTVKDIQPNAAKPQLELSFPRADGVHLSSGGKATLTLAVHGTSWRGTMCNEGSRNIYLHTRLNDGRGGTATCTEVLAALGIAHDGRLEFEVIAPNHLRLLRIVANGAWPNGRDPADRRSQRAASAARPARRFVEAERKTVASSDTSFPFGDCAEIRRLATVYWDLITPTEAAEERRFEQEFAQARTRGFLSKELFVRVGRWKSVRQTSNYQSNAPEAVRTASGEAFAAVDDATALTALMRLKGVALRTASAILHWMRPDRFPVLDVRVVAALGLKEPRSYENFALYSLVATRVRDLARECDIDLRTMDRALWAWDKLRSRRRA